RCRDGLANLQLSWNARPLRTEILVQGTGGARRADVLPVFFPKARAAWTGPLDRVTSALAGALEPLAPESATSVFSEDPSSRADAGIEPLVAAFHDALDRDAPPPIALEDALGPLRWASRVADAARAEHAARIAALPPPTEAEVLVTGGSGRL